METIPTVLSRDPCSPVQAREYNAVLESERDEALEAMSQVSGCVLGLQLESRNVIGVIRSSMTMVRTKTGGKVRARDGSRGSGSTWGFR